jgi:hypothetical protein
MNSSAVANNKTDSKIATISSESIKVKDDIKEQKSSNRRSLIVMTAISVLILTVAVSLIYFFIKSNPDLVHANNQTAQVSQDTGFVNPNSVQQLEHDTKNITMKPVENSKVFIAFGIGMMAVMAGSFIFIKVKEYKEDN